MIKLFCAIVGEADSIFSVRVHGDDILDELKEAIKAENSMSITCDANELQLFLAKTVDGGWLKGDDPAALELVKGELHPDIQRMLDGKMMMASKTLQHWLFDKNTMPQPSTNQLHVLVVVPKQDASALSIPRVLLPWTTALDEPEKYAEECISLYDWSVAAVHKIPSIWKFMSNLGGCTKTGEIFWRMEEKQIVSLMVDGWFRESSPNNVNRLAGRRSIVMGSSGTGKSTLLCMMAFYLVFKHKKNVLVYRQVANINEENCLVYLGYENNKVVQFTVRTCEVQNAIKIYKELIRRHGTSNVWLLFDGFRYQDIPKGMRTFKMLATSQQLDMKSEEIEVSYTCMFPSWSKNDLLSMGGLIYKFSPENMEERYYYSGGSVREFTRATLADIRDVINRAIGHVNDGSKLLSNPFSMLLGGSPVDCLRHMFWIDPTKSFIYLENWVRVIDSEYAASVLKLDRTH